MASRRLHVLLACLLAGWLAACSSAVEPARVRSARVDAPPAAAEAAGALATASPLPSTAPDLVGVDLDALADLAADARLAVRVVAFPEEPGGGAGPALVTVQDPPAGAALRAGRDVLVWLGTPPDPQPAPPTAPTVAVPASEEPVVEDVEETRAAAPPPTEAPPPDVVAVAAGPAAPLRSAVPRSNIRTLPAAEPGTTLDGRASWYGEELRGSPVACGGRFDPDAATIASRELRCGTRVRITTADGSATDAVVTDWGPAEWTGKRVDLSRAVFEQLAPLSRGWVDVDVVVLGG